MGLQLPKRARNVVLGSAVSTVVLFLSGCTAEDKDTWKRVAMPEPATAEAPEMLTLWQWAWVAAGVTGLLTLGLILYAAFRFRRRSDDEIPVQTRYNLPIEIFYTIAPIMMVIVFFFFTVEAQNEVLDEDRKADYTVSVVGQQWSWTFNYNYDSGYNDFEGRAVGGEVVHEGGTPAEAPTLWLVKDKTVEVHLYAPDVIHSFWVPSFLFKLDVIPGRDNNFTMTPNRLGTFEGRCAELCGVYHSRMLFTVKVVEQSEYDDHLAALAEAGNTGPALGSSEAVTQTGLEKNGASE